MARIVRPTFHTGKLAQPRAEYKLHNITGAFPQRVSFGPRAVALTAVRTQPNVTRPFYAIGGRRLATFDTPSRTGRVFVVVNPEHQETLKSVMADRTDVKWSEMDSPRLLRKFSAASVYEVRPRVATIAVVH